MTDNESTIDCTTKKREEVIQSMLKYGLELIEVEDENKERYTLHKRVLLKNIERDIESKEGERFKGDVYLGSSLMETNPVTFSLQVGEEYYLPFLVDADRDGMTYCKVCQSIFWDLVDEEHRDSHFMPKRIVVEINNG